MRQLFKLKRQNLPFWGVYSQRIRTAYYENSDVYKDHWRRRAELLIDMFENREAETGIVYEVAEFGCGPNAPVSSICMDKKQYKSTKFDIKRWDSDTNILNLNDKNIEIPSSNIAVFSGVLEYLDDIESVLRRCMENCDYILLSYAFVPSLFQKIPFLSEYIYLKEINIRSAKNGWRNHYTNEELVRICSQIGVISSVNIWEARQTAILLRNKRLG